MFGKQDGKIKNTKDSKVTYTGALSNDSSSISKILASFSKDKSTQVRSCGTTTIENSVIIPRYYIAGSYLIFEGMDGGFDVYSNKGIKNESCVVFGVGENSQRCKDAMANFNQCEVVWDGRYDFSN